MAYDRLLVYFLLVGFSAGIVIKTTEVPKCDCTARVIPGFCYYYCYQQKASTSAPQTEQVLPVHDSYTQQPRQSQSNPQTRKHVRQTNYTNYPQAPQHFCSGCCPQHPRQYQPNSGWQNNCPNCPDGNCPQLNCGESWSWQPQGCPNCPIAPNESQQPPGWRGQNCPSGVCPQLPQCPQFYYERRIEMHVYNETSSCEPYGCGYYYGESYGYSWSTLYASYPGFEDHERINSPIKREILVSMPNIGYSSGNNLFFVNPSFARYIIARHWDPAGLLAHMDEPVLYKMIAINPGLDKRIASFTAEQIGAIFNRIYNHCHFLHKFSKKAQNTIMLKVMHLQNCKQTTTTTVTTAATPTTVKPVTSLYTEEEIAAIETKIPKFRKLLRAIPLETANKLKQKAMDNFPVLFLHLPGDVIKNINNFLNVFSDPVKQSPKFIMERTVGKSKDLFSLLVRQMFV